MDFGCGLRSGRHGLLQRLARLDRFIVRQDVNCQGDQHQDDGDHQPPFDVRLHAGLGGGRVIVLGLMRGMGVV